MASTRDVVLALIAVAAAAAAQQHPRFGALKKFWTGIELEIDGQDLAARLPPGRPRDAAGDLVLIVAPRWLFARRG